MPADAPPAPDPLARPEGGWVRARWDVGPRCACVTMTVMTAPAAASPPSEPGRVKRAVALVIFVFGLLAAGVAVSIGLYVAASHIAGEEDSSDETGHRPSRPSPALAA